MTHRFKLFRNLAFAVGIAIALGFGTTQAFARIGCSTPITACVGQGSGFCWNWCQREYGHDGGICNTNDDCCLCPEK